MLSFPPLPAWHAMHPLLVHFPIALLLIAPVFIIIGIIRKPERGFAFLLAAMLLMALGTMAAFAATSSGEAAGELVAEVPRIEAALDQHEQLAQITEIVFSVLCLIFAAILFVPRWLRCEPNRIISTVLPLIFLVFYAAGAVSLANTAHQGGRLVHELGVRAQIHSGALAVETTERE